MNASQALFLTLPLIASLTSCATGSGGSSTSAVEAHRRIVLAFYREGLVDRHPRQAFERYVSPTFIEHKPDVDGGTREGTVAFLEGLMNELPNGRWEILRTIAEGDLVVLHARFTPGPGMPPYAIADIFRVKDGLIVEHWDAVGPPSEHPRNPNTRF